MQIKREIFCDTGNILLTAIREEYTQHSFFYINLYVDKYQDIETGLKYLSDYMDEKRLEILMAYCFGSFKNFNFLKHIKLTPLTILSHSCAPGTSYQLICTDSEDVLIRESIGDIYVKSLNHFGTELFFVSNLASEKDVDNYTQTYSVFQYLKSIIKKYNIGFKGLARTWLYINDILEWYDELNRARTSFFNEENIFTGIVPASTGVGNSNITSKSLLLNALLIKSDEHKNIIRMLDSPLQCPATDYKSSFSRAVEISHIASKRLLISGTASIDSEGQTLHHDNIKLQIKQTMEVVNSIMRKEDYEWKNMVRGIAYFKEPDYVKHFIEYCRLNQIDNSYILNAGGTICRDDLLFEIEVDFVKVI